MVGVAILLAAIAINVLANHFGITTWHGFLRGEVFDAKATSLVFLFFVYPLWLGAAGYAGVKYLMK